MLVPLESSWAVLLKQELGRLYFRNLSERVREDYASGDVYPSLETVFRVFELCPFDTVKVVLLGQDPYHGKGQAMGLSFSVPESTRLPPSLRNIYKEIENEFKAPMTTASGDLTRWATQSVLLLNSILTVRAGSPGSHQEIGWEEFTDAVVRALSEKHEHLVFMLWGKYAKEKGAHIDRSKHLVLESPHPSPYSASTGFFGNGHFKTANEYLAQHGKKPIDWL